jgi:hypothetical protein
MMRRNDPAARMGSEFRVIIMAALQRIVFFSSSV